ncbi:hypothetical protein DFP72DRAFT_1084672 [Ephemerocybe angulata]|uniref:Uncharacterized protein n=1 Tax=Ephemerocybe angulata TaxID=980116 RepID=A0A8H6LSM0_9AGAR|nr:hypothetical protein DFP72DRAFT_1084672 [Tulosesus angulatus]
MPSKYLFVGGGDLHFSASDQLGPGEVARIQKNGPPMPFILEYAEDEGDLLSEFAPYARILRSLDKTHHAVGAEALVKSAIGALESAVPALWKHRTEVFGLLEAKASGARKIIAMDFKSISHLLGKDRTVLYAFPSVAQAIVWTLAGGNENLEKWGIGEQWCASIHDHIAQDRKPDVIILSSDDEDDVTTGGCNGTGPNSSFHPTSSIPATASGKAVKRRRTGVAGSASAGASTPRRQRSTAAGSASAVKAGAGVTTSSRRAPTAPPPPSSAGSRQRSNVPSASASTARVQRATVPSASASTARAQRATVPLPTHRQESPSPAPSDHTPSAGYLINPDSMIGVKGSAPFAVLHQPSPPGPALNVKIVKVNDEDDVRRIQTSTTYLHTRLPEKVVFYLQCHGWYSQKIVTIIESAWTLKPAQDTFLSLLANAGMPVTQAWYLLERFIYIDDPAVKDEEED